MQKTIIERLISILTEAEMDYMYHELAKLLSKSSSISPTSSVESRKATTSPELKVLLGAQCKRKRERLGLTMYAVAKTSGILQNQVKAIEEGNGYNIEAFLKLTCDLGLNVTLSDNDQ